MLSRECPFCGLGDKDNTLTTNTRENPHGQKWGYVQCDNCGACGPEVPYVRYDPEAWQGTAIGQWNRRA